MVVAGILAFVVALLLSVMIHEAGHFFTARHYGMKATQFFVGFGPTLWSRTRGETEYGIKAIPAGGFVKIVGMTPLEEVPPGDEDRAFYKQPAGRRTVVLSAGSFMHFVITIVLVLIASFAIGRVVEGPPALVATSACVASDATAGCNSPGSVPAPAKAAGVQPGDVVVSVNGTKIKDSEQFVRVIRDKAGVPVSLTVLRDGKSRQLTVSPAAVQRPSLDDPKVTERVGAIGVTVQRRIATERVGPVQAIQDSGETMTLIVKGIVVTLTEKLGTITSLYGNNRDPEGFIGVVGASRISGEVLASQETF
ncbi:MAG: site-2 protease family protein, partial [Mycobacteriales bacterium]